MIEIVTVDNIRKFINKEVSKPCWIWTRSKNSRGYGDLRRRLLGERLIHRIIYTLDKGPIPPGLTLDHLCRRVDCCNPDHLEAVTLEENKRRAIDHYNLIKGRTNKCSCGKKKSSRCNKCGSCTFIDWPPLEEVVEIIERYENINKACKHFRCTWNGLVKFLKRNGIDYKNLIFNK